MKAEDGASFLLCAHTTLISCGCITHRVDLRLGPHHSILGKRLIASAKKTMFTWHLSVCLCVCFF